MAISKDIVKAPSTNSIEKALIQGDLSELSAQERIVYYRKVCESVGLNELTQPFAYIKLNGKLTLYAKKDATDQLRKIQNISITITSREKIEDVFQVTAQAKNAEGRTDESIGAVTISNLKGDALANALMKAETKAKRRVTLSICGMGMLDETEIETIPPEAKPTIILEKGTDIREVMSGNPKPPFAQRIYTSEIVPPGLTDSAQRALKEDIKKTKAAIEVIEKPLVNYSGHSVEYGNYQLPSDEPPPNDDEPPENFMPPTGAKYPKSLPISTKQKEWLEREQLKHNWTDHRLQEWVQKITGQRDVAKIPMDKFKDVMRTFKPDII